MNLGKQIKKYRGELHLSQDELAEKIYVTRQSISNWENDKNYPDMQSLLLLSTLFGVPLDLLVRGDLEEMKDIVNQSGVDQFKKESYYYTILLVVMMISPVPLYYFLEYVGLGIWIVIVMLGVYYAWKIEKQKKSYDIQSYKEIVAFMEGDRLSFAQKHQEQGKRNYQKFLLAVGCGLVTFFCGLLMLMLFKMI